MKTNKRLGLSFFNVILVGLILMISCSDEKKILDVEDKDNLSATEVKFVAQNGETETRTTAGGDQWLTTDEIGIFMINSGSTLGNSTIAEGVDNRKYNPQMSAASTALLPAAPDQTIYYPSTGLVDFIAYYPRKETGTDPGELNNYIYPVNVSNQSNMNELDLLYAKKTGLSKTTSAVELQFRHKLSKITMQLKDGGVNKSFTNATAQINGMPTTANFLLSNGTLDELANLTSFFAQKTETTVGYLATFQAIIIPQGVNVYADRNVQFVAESEPYQWVIPTSTAFEAGKHYTYILTIDQTGIIDVEVRASLIGTIIPWEHESYTNLNIETELIPAGTFMMGGSLSEPGTTSLELPQHEVTLTKDFRMSKYLVTNAQYADFLNTLGIQGEELYSSGYYFIGNYKGNKLIESTRNDYDWGLHWDKVAAKWIPATGYEKHPVIGVTWYGANDYAKWLGGSLPTEAQWEYACRAGLTGPFGVGYGHSLYANQANFNGKYPYALPNGTISNFGGDEDHSNAYLNKTSPVGSYDCNAWALYDMHGNVAEWCNDWYGSYSNLTASDPTGPSTGTYRILRGGSWSSRAEYCRSAYRNYGYPNGYKGYSRDEFAGFRVVFEP